MFRNTLLASLIAFGAATGAAYAAGSPVLAGGGDNAVVEYGGALPGTAVGGGVVTMSGGDDNRSFTYGAPQARSGQVGMLTGGGDNAQVVYQPATPAAGSFARTGISAIRG